MVAAAAVGTAVVLVENVLPVFMDGIVCRLLVGDLLIVLGFVGVGNGAILESLAIGNSSTSGSRSSLSLTRLLGRNISSGG